jgi:RimJ/RimL family protein N-acetyltransferase
MGIPPCSPTDDRQWWEFRLCARSLTHLVIHCKLVAVTDGGQAIELRPLRVDDRAEAEAFVARFPAGEKAFFDRSLISQVAIAGWTRQTPGRRLGAFQNGRLVALLSIIPGTGWVSHVGEMRLVVAPEARGKGVAGLMLERSNDLAHDLELSKLTIEVAAVHERLIAMFTRAGFVQEALLKDHVRETAGTSADLLILSKFLEPAS